jgi:hypothetical protein
LSAQVKLLNVKELRSDAVWEVLLAISVHTRMTDIAHGSSLRTVRLELEEVDEYLIKLNLTTHQVNDLIHVRL